MVFDWVVIGAFVVGIIAGYVASAIRFTTHQIGTLREDRSDPDSPYLFLEIDKGGYQKIHSLPWVCMTVLLKDYTH